MRLAWLYEPSGRTGRRRGERRKTEGKERFYIALASAVGTPSQRVRGAPFQCEVSVLQTRTMSVASPLPDAYISPVASPSGDMDPKFLDIDKSHMFRLVKKKKKKTVLTAEILSKMQTIFALF